MLTNGKRFLLLLLCTATFGCSDVEKDTRHIGVVVTIPPQAEFVERIGGDRVRVSVLVPAGANPHTYEPTPSRLVEVSKADLFVKVGTPIEFEVTWLSRILELNDGMTVVDCSEGIDLEHGDGVEENHRDHEHEENHEESGDHEHEGSLDPHIWTSPANAAIMVRRIAEALSELDPSGTDRYRAASSEYISELEELDRDIAASLAGKRNRIFITFHPAWGYLARRYGLEQLSIETEGKEPSARWIAHLVDRAKQDRIRVVFASPEFNAESAEVIAREIGGRVVPISALARDYASNLRRAARALAASME